MEMRPEFGTLVPVSETIRLPVLDWTIPIGLSRPLVKSVAGHDPPCAVAGVPTTMSDMVRHRENPR
jgi:hypothetical protein